MDTWDKIVISGRALAVFLLVLVVLALVGCAGHTTKADGTKEPASVGVMREASNALKNCPAPEAFTPVEVPISSCEPGDDACHNAIAITSVVNGFVKLEHHEEIAQNADKSCPAQVVKAVESYFDSQNVKYKAIATTVGTVIKWSGGYLVVDALTGNITRPSGDTNISEVNISGEAGAGGEGAGGSNTMNTNIGGSQQILSGGSAISGTKAQVPAGDLSDDDGNNSTLNSDGLF